jgi:hypothetical protein
MILILTETADVATDFVMDWLMMDCIEVIRIDNDTKINHIYLNENSFEFATDRNQIVKSEEIEKVWIRRPHSLYSAIKANPCKISTNNIYSSVYNSENFIYICKRYTKRLWKYLKITE